MTNTPDIESLFSRATLPRPSPRMKDRIMAAVEEETRPVIPFSVKLAVAAALMIGVALTAVSEHRSRAFTQSMASTREDKPPSREEPWGDEFQGHNFRTVIAVERSPAPMSWKQQVKEVEALLHQGDPYDI